MANQRNTKIYFYIALIVLILAIALILLFTKAPGFWLIFSDQQKIRNFISSFGVKAPMILIALQVLQIIFAPIPGHFIGFSAGYLFGIFKGTFLCLLGIGIGSTITFWLSRVFGRRLLLIFINPESMKRFDNYIVRKGPFIIFILLLIPFSPLGDVVYYLSGLTAIPFGFFLLMVIIARLPSNFIYSLLGAKAFSFTVREWLIFLIVLVILTLLFYRNRRRIERIILRFVKLS